MGFANLTPLVTVGGIAALAAVLYALQILRIRFRQQEVPTLLFWKEAVSEAPVRTFRQRFRHPWAYLLILIICSLLWLAIAEPEWRDDEDAAFYVLVLDGSAGMARPGRFEQALADLEDDLRQLPADQRQVIWAGAAAETLLNPGEHPLLLLARLADKTPEAVPASVERSLMQLASVRRDAATTQVRVYGEAPVSAAVIERLPAGVSVRSGSSDVESDTGNAGVTALGVGQAASGNWTAVDLLVRVEGDTDALPAAEEIVVQIDDRTLPASRLETDADGATYRVLNVPADGGLVSVALPGEDTLPLDNRAQLRLPTQQPIRVQLSETLPPVLAAALNADSAIELVNTDPDVVIRLRGESSEADVPTLEFVDADVQTEAFLLGYPETDGSPDAMALLNTAVQRIGLANIDASGLAEATERPVEVAMQPDSEWRFSVWQELLSEDYNFVQSRSFPLFVAQSVRWLAGVEKWYPYLAAGQPLPVSPVGNAPAFVDADGQLIDTLGVDFVPNRAGLLHRASRAEPLAVSLLDSAATTGWADGALQYMGLDVLDTGLVRNVLVWLLLLALTGLLVEWWLYQKGRMP